MLEFYTDVVRKARKVHKCNLCYQSILAGEQYHRQSGKYEGEFFDRCIHEHCNSIISAFCKENNEQEYSEDWIIDWLGYKYCYGCEHGEDCKVNILQCEKILKNFRG